MVPLLRNGIEVSVVTNTSVRGNTVTNSSVSYTQRLAKNRYALNGQQMFPRQPNREKYISERFG
jgi:hypothetical protein